MNATRLKDRCQALVVLDRAQRNEAAAYETYIEQRFNPDRHSAAFYEWIGAKVAVAAAKDHLRYVYAKPFARANVPDEDFITVTINIIRSAYTAWRERQHRKKLDKLAVKSRAIFNSNTLQNGKG